MFLSTGRRKEEEFYCGNAKSNVIFFLPESLSVESGKVPARDTQYPFAPSFPPSLSEGNKTFLHGFLSLPCAERKGRSGDVAIRTINNIIHTFPPSSSGVRHFAFASQVSQSLSTMCWEKRHLETPSRILLFFCLRCSVCAKKNISEQFYPRDPVSLSIQEGNGHRQFFYVPKV